MTDNTPSNATPAADMPAARADFRSRLKAVKTTRWIRFGVVTLVFILWVIWLGNPWVLLLLPLLFDIYITGYIPFTWWKKSKNRALKAVMSWVDAIVYALILVYFVFTFVGQNYEIPSSSLEKSLLVGDYLWVNKMAYGPRVPQTPLHFPLVQNTFPIINTKSYSEWPQWRYHRLKGLGNVKSGDIVVFNFPAGDTVALKMQNPDYYTLLKVYGREVINDNPDRFGEVVYRPVDRRENYVKRAVGLPGETLKIVDGHIYVDGKPQAMPDNVQFNYVLQSTRPLSAPDWEALGVAVDDYSMAQFQPHPADSANWASVGIDVATVMTQPMYCLPLTQAMVKSLKESGLAKVLIKEPEPVGEFLFPDVISASWSRRNYGPVLIPKKGMTIRITPGNWPMYERVIRNYEYHYDSYVKDGKVYIDGRPADTYTFEMDYYFMMGDNRDCSLDSRYWGFVPEDHIVGKPMRVLISFDKDKGLLNGGIRWNRVLKDANPGFSE